MKRVLLMLMVTCLLISSVYDAGAKEITDSVVANIVTKLSVAGLSSDYAGQYFDNRNNDANVTDVSGVSLLPWLNTSKGDYFVLDVMIQTGGALKSFDDIIEVTAQSSAYPKLTFPLFRLEGCPYFLQHNWQEFYLHLRYSPWMQTSTWTYTMKYLDKKDRTHVQTFAQPAPSTTSTTLPISAEIVSATLWDGTTCAKCLKWQGIGDPRYQHVSYKTRIYDQNGCIITELPSLVMYDADGNVYFDVGQFSGQVVRAESRKYELEYGYGVTARSVYVVRVP